MQYRIKPRRPDGRFRLYWIPDNGVRKTWSWSAKNLGPAANTIRNGVEVGDSKIDFPPKISVFLEKIKRLAMAQAHQKWVEFGLLAKEFRPNGKTKNPRRH